MYSKVLLFQSDHTRNTLVSPTPKTQQYQVVQLIAQKLGLYHYFVGEGDEMCAVVTRVDTQLRVRFPEQAPKRSAEFYYRSFKEWVKSTLGRLRLSPSSKRTKPAPRSKLYFSTNSSHFEHPSVSSDEAPFNEESGDELDFNQPSTLKTYSEVLLFKNDDTRPELVCSTLTPQEYDVVKLVAQKLGLFHYSVGKRSTIVTRLDTQSGDISTPPRTVSNSQTLSKSPTPTFNLFPDAHDFQIGHGTFTSITVADYLYSVTDEEDDGEVINSASNINYRPAGVIERGSLPWDDPLLNQAWKDYHERIGQYGVEALE
ncbi:hypothetical protein BDP27DRAFT_1404854 [Rhodocollybia butyracea]|uniref:Uncharacterized protein n=1 Tax=Rhodocollybia butyracea TaxID=206335 RepID=A0A9P5PMQ2_9AGAR|nr:hypothetical protein BDP27DRAFT_1404854 [Rhodocollybia butyracea]